MDNRIQAIKQLITGGDTRSATIKKNIIYSFLVKGISILVSLILVPLTLGYVSAEIYGVWLTISSILHWLTYMDVGFTLGLKNRLAECLAKGDTNKGRVLVSTTYGLMTCIFVPLTALLILVSPHINWCSILNISSIYNRDIQATIEILFIFIALQMIVNVFVAVVAAHQKTALSSLFNVIGQVCSLLIIGVMTLYVKPSLFNLAIAYSLMPIIVVAISSVIFYKSSMKKVAPSLKYIDFSYAKDLWNLGAKFFIIQIQQIVLYQATNILISHLSGPSSVAQYNIAYKILNVVIMVYQIILTPLWPAFTDAYAKQDYEWMNRTYRKMVQVYILLAVGLCTITILSQPIYRLWVGNNIEIPFVLTTSVAIYTLVHSWDSLQVTLINGIGKVKLQTRVILVGLILHIPLSLLIGKYIQIYGVIISMCIINVIYAIVFTTQLRKILNHTARGIWTQ